MAAQITKETTYLAEVEDRPGILAEALRAVADAGINLSLLAGWPSGPGRAKVCCIPDNPEKLKSLAWANGFSLSEQTVFIVRGDDQPGALVEATRKLGNAGINIRDVAALSVDGKFAAVLVVNEPDVARAAAALGV